ncbi:GNAT family N-acetyltransferase [Planococcus rifietoensis]|uniref:GNAT family N-acetyltransferase n=1 Tax=Planococcus rifietoensis TaxID=200991 RepID=UPI00384B8303
MFKTERCAITKLQESDYNEVKRIYENQEVRKFLGGIHQEASIGERFREMLDSSHDFFYWVVREKQTETMIGLVSLDLHHEGVYQEISYQFLPCWWGKGYASEVISVVIHFALYELNLPLIVAETQTANKASCKLLERLGMELERTIFRFGADQAIYSIRPLK